MLRARLRGRTRRSGRTSFNSSLGGCACSRFLRDRGVWQVLSLLDRPTALGPWPNVCEGNPATRKTNSCANEKRVVNEILEHLGLPTSGPPIAPARIAAAGEDSPWQDDVPPRSARLSAMKRGGGPGDSALIRPCPCPRGAVGRPGQEHTHGRSALFPGRETTMRPRDIRLLVATGLVVLGISSARMAWAAACTSTQLNNGCYDKNNYATRPGYIYPVNQGDLQFWDPIPGDLLSTLQNSWFNPNGARAHSSICESSSSGNCTRMVNTRADFSVSAFVDKVDKCAGKLSPNACSVLQNLGPGVSYRNQNDTRGVD